MAKKDTLITTLVNPLTNTTTFSLATSFNTPATVVRFLDNCSYQMNVVTTDSVGSFAVQMSNDYYVNPASGVIENQGNWIPLTLTSAMGAIPTVAATSTNISINLNQLPFYAVRLAYTSTTAGTGTAQIFIADKVIGN